MHYAFNDHYDEADKKKKNNNVFFIHILNARWRHILKYIWF